MTRGSRMGPSCQPDQAVSGRSKMRHVRTMSEATTTPEPVLADVKDFLAWAQDLFSGSV